MDYVDDQVSNSNLKKRIATYCLLIFLLILRIILINIQKAFFPELAKWIIMPYFFTTYLSISLLIFINKDDLPRFHIDKLSLIFIIIFSILYSLYPTKTSTSPIYIWGFWGISLGNLIILIRKWSKLQNVKSGWIVLGTLIGFVEPILYINIIFRDLNTQSLLNSRFFSILTFLFIAQFMFTVGHSALYEEYLFRGFLWGAMRYHIKNEILICFFQAILFFLAHSYDILINPSDWIYSIVFMFLYGWLAWRSRSVVPSMLSHTLYNDIMSIAYYLRDKF